MKTFKRKTFYTAVLAAIGAMGAMQVSAAGLIAGPVFPRLFSPVLAVMFVVATLTIIGIAVLWRKVVTHDRHPKAKVSPPIKVRVTMGITKMKQLWSDATSYQPSHRRRLSF